MSLLKGSQKLSIFEKKTSDLDDAIDRVLKELNNEGLDTEEYARRLKHLERLTTLRVDEHKKRVSPDTWAIVGANILGILIIVGYEQGHVLASKGLGMILKTKSN